MTDPRTHLDGLCRDDPPLAALIERVGPYQPVSRATRTVFQCLLRSVVSQQLSTKAAASIHDRVKRLFPQARPSPARLLELDDQRLRDAGLSGAKIRTLRDLASKTLDGSIPPRRILDGLDDEAIIESLTRVHGIGRWSAQMLLINQLQRPDVLPASDLGIRRGFMLHRGDPALPPVAELLAHGDRWRPYRTIASWYLWRALELDWPGPRS
ncbi:MAG: DNA-3-methyladenine glycosylase 2 family protein [Gammaproteobacteria bacterium]|nr:DNA-3-methyladenine glycosylase 2 family protein [Gammaproteobacteria bacterium]